MGVRQRVRDDLRPERRTSIAQIATLDTREAKGPEAGPTALRSWGEQRADRLATNPADRRGGRPVALPDVDVRQPWPSGLAGPI